MEPEPAMGTEPEAQSVPKPAKILVVENEYLIASLLTRVLEDAGYAVIGPVFRGADGCLMIRIFNGQIDAAILDVCLNGEQSYPIAEELSKRKVPFLFTTTYSWQEIAPEFADRPYLSKPYTKSDLLRTLARIMKRD